MSALSDDEYLAQVEASLAHLRARNRAFLEAVEQITVPRLHDAVRARFDSNGTLVDLDIAPEALTAHTNVELEQIVTTVLRQTRAQVLDQMDALLAKYLAPGDPRFDPNALGEPYVGPPDPDL
ncbi:YbaB/EbfC family nucleoid-associated protein [Mycolicibacterium septicum]|uniref:YbaB/EbfC family nucleoid-associated protein n=1 Tax=Mycolicibacterium septicum TaxID=98668 RepID=UPI00235E048A|nr:YbaB/EbfC family nucleoid-associated protein [Mycolicibacterium septicum]